MKNNEIQFDKTASNVYLLEIIIMKVIKKRRDRRLGMTLLEVVIAMFIFALLALSITAMVLQSRTIAQNNVMRNTAYSVAQGYLEQIKSAPIQDIKDAITAHSAGNWAQTDLPTKSVSALESGSIEEQDPLFLGGPIAGELDEYPGVPVDVNAAGWNYKQVMIDLQEDEDGNMQQLVMDMWLDVTINSLGLQTNAYEVIIDFQYETRNRGGQTHGGSVRNIRTDLNAL